MVLLNNLFSISMKLRPKCLLALVIVVFVIALSGCALRSFSSVTSDVLKSKIDSIKIIHTKVNYTGDKWYGTYGTPYDESILCNVKFIDTEITDTLRGLLYRFFTKVDSNEAWTQAKGFDAYKLVNYENDSTYIGIEIYFNNTVYLFIRDFHYSFFQTKYSTYSNDHISIYAGKTQPNLLERIPFAFSGKELVDYMKKRGYGYDDIHGEVVNLANNLIEQYNKLSKGKNVDFIPNPVLRKK